LRPVAGGGIGGLVSGPSGERQEAEADQEYLYHRGDPFFASGSLYVLKLFQ
jgi:hypothetical protein